MISPQSEEHILFLLYRCTAFVFINIVH